MSAAPNPRQVKEIFEQAMNLASAEERERFVKQACGDDMGLLARVRELLQACAQTKSYVTKNTDAQGPEATQWVTHPADTTVLLPMSEKAGDRLGRYKLLEMIGEGGCGVVYVAEQLEPVRRRVALKVVKLGMDTKQVMARFEAERQALALMDHPHIAKVFDAGATDAGRPYFVMELVRGVRITQFCDERQLSLRERLDLFMQVCRAIQHAHQKGIIHRDIKPSNILVTLTDGVPVPKVIDFGIAKATAGRLTEQTLITMFEQFLGTPAYMSPEQADVRGEDIDTRSDIYSLGAVLYELLTGRTPFESETLLKWGIEEFVLTLRDVEPPRPSTRLGALAAADLNKVAQSQHSEPAKLVPGLRGDLDWIVMKCLEKDRTRRYDTANGLAMDIQRYLSGEAVVAAPPSTAYRMRKFVRRHRVGVIAASLVALVLVLGVIGTTGGMLWALREKGRANQEAAKATLATRLETEARRQAEDNAKAARRAAYSSDMNLVQQALAANNLGRAQRLLNRQRPQPGQPDLRDWEWRYLWSQTRADDHESFFAGTNRILWPLFFSADGRLLVRQDEQQTVVTDVPSRRAVWRRTNASRPVFAHHGVFLAFVDGSSTNDAITLLDMATEKESRIQTSWRSTRWIGFTPDDQRLLTVSLRPGDRTADKVPYDLMAWDVGTGRRLWQRAIGMPKTLNGRPYAISPDGAAFAAVLPDGRVQVLETRDGSERFTITATEEIAMAVTFSPDSSILLTGAGYTDSAIRLWDARSGTARGSLEGHRSWVSDLLFSPDGKVLISSSGDQTIRMWDWATFKPAGVLCGHLDEVDGLALAPNGRTLASRCKDGSIYLWDVTQPSRHPAYRTLPGRLDSSSIVFTPDNRSILGADLKGGVAQWDAFTLKETRRLPGDFAKGTDTIISPDARWVMQGNADGRLRVWDVRSGLESTNFVAAPGRFNAWITGNGRFLVTLYGPPTNTVLETWDTGTWQKQGSLSLPFKSVMWGFTTSRPNSFVISTDRTLRLFDVAKLNEAPLQIESRGDLLGLAASPDGRMIAAAYEDGSVRLWDVAALKLLESLKGFLLAATSVAFSPDGRRLAATSNGQEAVKLWDAETRQEVLTLSGDGSQFFDLKFSSDGRFLLAVNSAGIAHLWSAPSWEEIAAAEADEKKAPQP
jgi:WD40 repeat protein/tRNA A-37 threonylcarbamoyl transferase component Bud32